MTSTNKNILIRSLAIVLTAVAGVFCSCEKQKADEAGEVKIECATEVMKNAVNLYVNVIAKNDWTLSLTFDEGTAGWASLGESKAGTISGSGENLVLLNFGQNNTKQDRSLYLILVSGSRSDTAFFVQRNYLVEKKDIPSKVPGWMELPKCDNQDLEFYIHDMVVGGKTYRNYSFYYDATRLVSHWVAYPMWKTIMSTGGRSDAWGLYDPLISESRQQYLNWSYPGHYDRGHQLPSRDRNIVGSANVATFYGPNITPQLDNLNQAGWATLEGKVHNWTVSFDTLYIVTGCTVMDSKTTVTENNGKRVSVPTAYYKALLGYKKPNSYYSIAFYYPHVAYSGTVDSKALTVSDLETKLQNTHNEKIHFFTNLPEAKKTTIKNQNYSNWISIAGE